MVFFLANPRKLKCAESGAKILDSQLTQGPFAAQVLWSYMYQTRGSQLSYRCGAVLAVANAAWLGRLPMQANGSAPKGVP